MMGLKLIHVCKTNWYLISLANLWVAELIDNKERLADSLTHWPLWDLNEILGK